MPNPVPTRREQQVARVLAALAALRKLREERQPRRPPARVACRTMQQRRLTADELTRRIRRSEFERVVRWLDDQGIKLIDDEDRLGLLTIDGYYDAPVHDSHSDIRRLAEAYEESP